MTAEIQTTTLLRSLAIALVIVAPYGVIKWRQVQARRRERAAAIAALEEPQEIDPRPRLEDVIDEIARLADSGEDGPRTFRVPHDATVDGVEVAPVVLDALVRDAMRRSGLVATAELDTAEGRTIECTRAPQGKR